MIVSELIDILKQCNPEDTITVSVSVPGFRSKEQRFYDVVEINEVTPKPLGSITLLTDS